ncbi:MAG: terminase family protein [Clostridia bacterium]|nr:terminase family protein [Clostridia bacterium]
MSKSDELIIYKIKKIENILTERKKIDKLSKYNSGRKKHKKQILFHKCKKKNRWVFGGNRSGKTECGAVECVYLARGIHPYRKNKKDTFGWVVSLSREVQRDVAQTKILHYLNPLWIDDITMVSGKKDSPKHGIIDQIRVKNIFGGISVIGFKSCDQGREKFQGASLDFVWFDEEPPKDVYDECRMRVFDKNGDIFGTMTPLKGLTFVHDEIYLNKNNDPEVWCEFMEWGDNPFLNKKEIEKLSLVLSDDSLQSRKYGKFSASSGLVYPEFDENIHVIEPFKIPSEWQDKISIDPGLNNPLSAHWYAVDYDGVVYVVFEHFLAGKDVEYHANEIKKISDAIGWKKDSFGRVGALIDSAANQRTLSSVKSVSELFFEHGIAVNPKVNKDMFSGIQRVKEYLKIRDGRAKIYIFNNCVNLIRELKTYRWAEGDNPKKYDDHALDELRYYLMDRPNYIDTKREKTAIEIDKERLIKKLKNARRRKT